MKKIIITDIANLPNYFKCDHETIRVNIDTFTCVSLGTRNEYDIMTYGIDSLMYYRGSEVEPITKEEFEAELNKAFQEILNA